MRVAMLTGGGDCPGLNAVMRAVVRKGERTYGDELVGFLDGWKGVIDGATRPLDVEAMRGTLPRGGTVAAPSRSAAVVMEARGLEPRSEASKEQASTSVAVDLDFPRRAPDGGLLQR